MAFLVLSTLFDVMSFPHVPYILLSLAGLLAVVVRGADEEPPPAVRRAPEHEGRIRPGAAPRPAAHRRAAKEPVAG